MKMNTEKIAVTFDVPEQSSDFAEDEQEAKEKTNKMAPHHLSRLVSQDELGIKEAVSNDSKAEMCSPCLDDSTKLEVSQPMEMETVPRSQLAPEQVPPLPNPLDDLHVFKNHVSALRIEADLYPLRLVLSRLMSHPTYNKKGIFNQPVDPIALGLVDYNQIIQRKMDLGTIKRRLYAVAYPSRQEAIEDIRLVFTNAILYNPPHNLVHISAKELLSLFDSFCHGLDAPVIDSTFPPDGPDTLKDCKPEVPTRHSLSSPNSLSTLSKPETSVCSPSSKPSLEVAVTHVTGASFLPEQQLQSCPMSVTPHLQTASLMSTRQKSKTDFSDDPSGVFPSRMENNARLPRLRIPKRRATFASKGTHACERCKGRTCTLCLHGCLQHEPALLVCCGAQCNGSRIRKGAVYYITKDGTHQFCDRCYVGLPSTLVQSLQNEAHQYKKELLKRKNDEEIAEEWIVCSECSLAAHVVCAMYNGHVQDERAYRCLSCRDKNENNLRTSSLVVQPSPKNSGRQAYTFVTGAEEPIHIHNIMNADMHLLDSGSLVECPVSTFIEEKVCHVLQKSPNANKTVTVRVISDCDRRFTVPKAVRRYFRTQNGSADGIVPPESVQYRQKAIVMFQKIDGLDVCVFCMYVQEYDGEDEGASQKRVYIAYIDSVEHFRPRELRTEVFHEILIAYLATARERGYHKAHIWACPPSRGNCFVFWNHPVSQRTPTSERLLAWYHGALSRAIQIGVVADVKSLYETDFEQQLSELSNSDVDMDKSRMKLPPLIDGDFWIDEAVRVHQTAIDRNLKVRSPSEVCVWNVGDYPRCRSPCPALQLGSLLKDRVMTHPSSVPFRRPVNAAAMKLKNYHSIITKPIDLGTIYSRCILGEYERLQDVVDDVSLMVENAQKFNPPDHVVNQMAVEVLELFHSELDNLTKLWSTNNTPDTRWQSNANLSMSLDVTVEMELSEASPDQVSDNAIVVIEDDRSSDGSGSLSASVSSVFSRAHPKISIEDNPQGEAERPQNASARRRGRPKKSKALTSLDIYTDGPEAVMQRMVGEDTWMLDRRNSEPSELLSDSGKKRRRSLYDGVAAEDEQTPKRRRQSWLCEEVGRSIRRMRTFFFACSLCPSDERTPVEESKLLDYNNYVATFQREKCSIEFAKSSLADTRSAVLELSQFRNFEFDTLRRAKYSTCMLLYYLHHPNAPGSGPECTSCGCVIEGVRWHKAAKICEVKKSKMGLQKIAATEAETFEDELLSRGDLCSFCYERNQPMDEDFIPIPVSFQARQT
jgi:hypothetical protein